MAIIVNLDVMLAKRKMQSQELADKIGITTANLSILNRQGKSHSFFYFRSHLQRIRMPTR